MLSWVIGGHGDREGHKHGKGKDDFVTEEK